MNVKHATRRYTVAQALVMFLQQQYSCRDGDRRRLIPAALGIFGHGNVAGVGQAIEEYGDKLPLFQGRNEQSMVHVAAAYAKASQRRSTLAVTASIGPGSTNMLTGAAGATINRLPVLLLPSDYYVTRHQGNVLQQLEHPSEADLSVNDCFRPVSKFFDRISRPEQLLTALPEAMRVLTDVAETGAVTISLPQDVQAYAYDFPEHFFVEREWDIERRRPDADQIVKAVEVLRSAKYPLLIAGGGVHYSEATAELERLSAELGIPVVETFAGKGAMQIPSWRNLGGLGLEGNAAANEVARRADAVICVGTRLTDFATSSRSLFENPSVQFIGVNVNSRDAHKLGALAIVGDARHTLEAISAEAFRVGLSPNEQYQHETEHTARGWQATLAPAVRPVQAEVVSQGQVIKALNDFVSDGDTVIAAAGSLPGDLLKMWDATGGRNCHLEFGFSCMGYELPAAVGVRMAQIEGDIYALVGDGTYLLNPTEIVTAAQERLKLTVIIFENHGFQSIHRLQMRSMGVSFGNEFRMRDMNTGRLEGEYVSLDLAATARGFGALSFHVETLQDFKDALIATRGHEGPSVIVVAVDPNLGLPAGGAWFDIAPAEVSERSEIDDLRTSYEEGRRRQQFLY